MHPKQSVAIGGPQIDTWTKHVLGEPANSIIGWDCTVSPSRIPNIDGNSKIKYQPLFEEKHLEDSVIMVVSAGLVCHGHC